MIQRETPKTGLPVPPETEEQAALLRALSAEVKLATPCDWARLLHVDGDDAPILCPNPAAWSLTFRDACEHRPDNPFPGPRGVLLCQGHMNLWVHQPGNFTCMGCGCPLIIVGHSHVLLCPPARIGAA